MENLDTTKPSDATKLSDKRPSLTRSFLLFQDKLKHQRRPWVPKRIALSSSAAERKSYSANLSFAIFEIDIMVMTRRQCARVREECPIKKA